MSFMDSIFGSQGKFSQKSTLAPFQKQALKGSFGQGAIQNQPVYQQGLSQLMKLLQGGPEAMQNFQAPYLQQFQQQVAPQIAERFAGAGTGAGAGSSSALFNSLAQAGGNLSNNLAGQFQQAQMQALPQALGYAQQPLNNTFQGLGVRPFENVYQPGQQGLIQTLLQSLAQGAGKSMGGGFF